MSFQSVLPNGMGESLADSLAVNAPFYTTGQVWYVNSATGADDTEPWGLNATRPLATLAQAQTNASDGDVIVLMDGHTETIAALAITKRLLIVGGGRSDGNPTVKLSPSGSGATLSVTGDGVELRNIWFEEHAETSGDPLLSVAGSRFRAAGCRFEAGAFDDTVGVVELATAETTIEFYNCTWVSVSEDPAAQPAMALATDGQNITHLVIRECTIDGGTVGWATPWAIDLSDGTVTDLRIENITLLRGSDVYLDYATAGYVGGVSSTGSAVIKFEGAPA